MHTTHIKAGDIISIRHYSGINPFRSVVIDINSDMLQLKLTKDFAIMNFLEGDPIVFGYDVEGQIYVFGGTITKIDSRVSVVNLAVDKVEAGSEKRQFERYPVSLYADIRTKNDRKKQLVTIKDMSYYGMKVFSRAELEEKQEIEVDIYMDKNMVFLKATVMRKSKVDNNFEYGLGIHYEDSNSINVMKDYIKRLMNEQEDAIRKLRNK